MSRSTVPEEISASMMPTRGWDICFAAYRYLGRTSYDNYARGLLLGAMRMLCDDMDVYFAANSGIPQVQSVFAGGVQ